METEGVTFHPKGVTSEAELGNAVSNLTTLARAMHTIGVTWVDILKIDVEGAEWKIFEDVLYRQGTLASGVPFSQVWRFLDQLKSMVVLHS